MAVPRGIRSCFCWKLHPSSQAWPLLSTSNHGETAIAKCRNLIFILSEDIRFANFLQPYIKLTKKSKAKPKRGLTDDDESVPEDSRLTAAQKVVILEHMLGQIANYCPIISRNTIVKNSTSLEDIWQAIRLHFGLQHTSAQFLDFAEIRQEPGEEPEDLYQRLFAFVDDNLLTLMASHKQKMRTLLPQ